MQPSERTRVIGEAEDSEVLGGKCFNPNTYEGCLIFKCVDVKTLR